MNQVMPEDALTIRLREIRQRILQRAPQTLQDAVNQMTAAERGELSKDERERTYLLIHNLAGTSGSVGLPEVGRTSKVLDVLIRPWLRGGEPAPDWRPAFSDLVTAVQAAQDQGSTNA